jgi:thiosulfate reductase/polysulfide reductase chain A
MANPAYANPNTAETVKLLKDEKRVPFLVVADNHLTETGALADILLPMATYLESWNLETRPAIDLVPFVSIRQPLVPPMGKSVALGDFCLEVSKKIGGEVQKALPYSGSEDFINKAASKIDVLATAGRLDTLKKEGFWFDPAARPAYRSFEKKGFHTPSGKLEIFSRRLEERGLPALPAYVPIAAHQYLKDDELILSVNRANVMTPRLGNAKWLTEILHVNQIWINPQTGQARGLQDGDRVKISSTAGQVTAKVRFSQGIHPRVVSLTEGLGHSQFGKFALAKKEKSSDFDTGEIWWDQEGNGINSNTIVTADFETAGGGICWNDTKVTLKKV